MNKHQGADPVCTPEERWRWGSLTKAALDLPFAAGRKSRTPEVGQGGQICNISVPVVSACALNRHY